MPDPKKAAIITKEIEALNHSVKQFSAVCKEIQGMNAKEQASPCSLETRKKLASGQHGIKESNVTYKQALESTKKRIDMLKLDVAKKTKELAAVS